MAALGRWPTRGVPPSDCKVKLVPLDEERRAESEVWLAFTGHALVDPTSESDPSAHPGQLQRLRGAVTMLADAGLAGDLDVTEASRLRSPPGRPRPARGHAPEQVPPSRVTTVIARHLDTLQADGAVLAAADVEQLPSSWRRLRVLIEPCAVQAALRVSRGLLSDELTPCTR